MTKASKTKRRIAASIWVFLAAAGAALATLKACATIHHGHATCPAPLWAVPAALAAVLALTALLCAVRPVTVAPVRWLLRRIGGRRS
jgi:hypothetical protein